MNADTQRNRRPWGMALRFLAAAGVFLGIIQAAHVVQAWLRAERALGVWDWLWLGLLPVLLFVFFRYYSVFRKDCRACLAPPPDRPAE